jgi:fructose-1,6-bisphosphatase I
MLVFSTGEDVNGFTLDQSLGEFILSHKNICSPKAGKIFSVNEGNYYSYMESVQKYLDNCKRNGFIARYIGSLVGDFHRNLLKGGIYLYPSTKKEPKGKLRLLYECYPLAFLAEKSGGKASDGFGAILDIVPTSGHQRSPIYVGSADMVQEAVKP